MNKNCIISFANSRGAYIDRLARLSNSLRENFDGEFLSWIGEDSLGCDKHFDNPYSFKIHAFNKAKEMGYTKILWLDSSVFAVNKVQKIFDDVERQGIVCQDAGHLLGNWSSNESLEYFAITRDEAMGMKCIGNAGLLALDFDNPIAVEFFNRWEASMLAGMFKGLWTNTKNVMGEDERIKGHRHDLTCSSAIINLMGKFHLAYQGDEVLMYGGLYDALLNDTIIFKAQG